MKALLAPFLLSCTFAAAQAVPATGAGDSLTFSLDRVGPPLVQFQIQVDRTTGRGSYEAKANAGGVSPAPPTEAKKQIVIADPVLKQIFAAVPAVVNHRCESHSRNLAQTGKKTLRFAHEAAVAECNYNYSDDERVNTATDLFQAVAVTLDFGQTLAGKLRFDRLGLDTEMDELETAVKDNRAVELGNIAPVLRAIEGDDRVLERVRRKAAHLLEAAGVPATQPGGDPGGGPGSSGGSGSTGDPGASER